MTSDSLQCPPIFLLAEEFTFLSEPWEVGTGVSVALEMGSERMLKWAQPEDACVMRLSQAELAAPALPPASPELPLQTAPPLTWYPPLKSPFPALTLSTCSALNDPGSP